MFYFPSPSLLNFCPSTHFHPASTLRSVRLILHLTHASLPHPCPLLLHPPPSPFPPKTNLIPSWPGRETEAMRLEVEGRHTAERGQERAPMAPPQRPARGGAGTNSSSIPGTQHPCFCSYHITRTHTHADSPGMLSKQHEIHCCNVCCFFFFSSTDSL